MGLRTLAYVVTECQEDARGFFGHQALRVQRGERAPVTVMPEFRTAGPVADFYKALTGEPVCQFFGEDRFGDSSLVAGVFERLGVTPDGSGVVFEVTNDFQIAISKLHLDPDQRGIFFMRADGSGLRRITDPSRDRPYQIDFGPPCCGGSFSPQLPFSHDGRTVLLTDRGPGPAGEDAVQIFTLDIVTGVRTQVTHLPRASSSNPLLASTGYPDFLADGRIVFYSYANPHGMNPRGEFMPFTVRRDGSELRASPIPVVPPGSRITQVFHITGEGRTLLNLAVPGELMGPPLTSGRASAISEVFVLDGRNLLQLSAFRRADTSGQFVSADGGRAFLVGSADPLGTNPTHNCQLFSIGTLGDPPRQLTPFREGKNSWVGCSFSIFPYGCAIGSVVEDPATHAVVFESNCNPFGTNPNGSQLFAMRPDGSRLRQLTDVRGYVRDLSGAVSAELAGPFAYSAARPSAAIQ